MGNSTTFFPIANKLLQKRKDKQALLTSIKLVFGDKDFRGCLLPPYLTSFFLLLCLLESPPGVTWARAELSCQGQCPWMNPWLDLLPDM